MSNTTYAQPHTLLHITLVPLVFSASTSCYAPQSLKVRYMSTYHRNNKMHTHPQLDLGHPHKFYSISVFEKCYNILLMWVEQHHTHFTSSLPSFVCTIALVFSASLPLTSCHTPASTWQIFFFFFM